MSNNFSDTAKAHLQDLKKLQDQVIVTPEVWVREMHIEPATPYFRTNNFIQNTLARLVGWYPSQEDWRRIIIDAQGRLEVSTIQASYDAQDVKTGNAPDVYGAAIAFDDIAKRLDIFIWDFPVKIMLSIDGIATHDEIEVPADTIINLDATTHSFLIKNKTAGQVGRYQLIGWW